MTNKNRGISRRNVEDRSNDETMEGSSTDGDVEDSSKDVMSALADKDCRSILLATAEEPLTVSELVDTCEIPTATVYRKVDYLTELSLLNERIRVKPRGRNSHEYLLQAEEVHVTILEQLDPAVTLKCTITTRDPVERHPTKISTDGGQVLEKATDQQHHLQQVFENVTGQVGFVETQQQVKPSRYSDDDRDMDISKYVTEAARDDGLSDAITIPEMDNSLE